MSLITAIAAAGRVLADRAKINEIINMLNGTAAAERERVQASNASYADKYQPTSDPADLTTIQVGGKNAAGTAKWGVTYAGQIRSEVPTGTSPHAVVSTTVVANLNVDKVDGIDTPASPTGDLVTTTNTQTLTNKSLTLPTIADFTNATHTHTAAASGGGLGMVPTGGMILYGAATAPAGYLLCNGAAVSRTTYAALFTAISTTFGAGDGSTTFNVPDMRGRFPLGVDGAAARITSNDALGNSSGSEAHDHASFTSAAGTEASDGAHGGASQRAATQHTHSIDVPSIIDLPPYQVVEYIIKT